MNIRKFSHEIYPEDCVGNSVGKHNYNALSFETQICNLSSTFADPNNVFTANLTGFLSQLNQLQQYGDLSRYNKMFSAVSLLSSYWNKQEFSVLYPLNISSINNQTIDNPTVFTPSGQLISSAKNYLVNNFPPINYPINTKINVNTFVYSSASNPADPNNLQTVEVSNEFSYLKRDSTVTLGRKDTHLASANIFQFINSGKDWLNTNIIGPNVDVNDKNRKKIYLNLFGPVVNYNVGIEAVKQSGYVAGSTDIVLTIGAGCVISSVSSNLPALTIGNLKNGDYTVIFNNGTIIGAGGTGGDGGDSADTGNTLGEEGKQGGTAVAAFSPCTIENYGKILAGGGGGAGGTGAITGSTSVGGGGGGGAGITGGIGGNRGQNAIFKSRGIVLSDTTLASNSRGGNGGPGLSSDPRASGAAGGEIGKPGKDSDSAVGGPAGFYVMGNNNVYWSILGEVAGNVG